MIAATRLVLSEVADILTPNATLGLSVFRMIADVGPDAAETFWFELDYFDSSECLDDRDRLAAFQWRLDQTMKGRSPFRTNYRLSTEENYRAFAASILTFSSDISNSSTYAEDGLAWLSIKMNLPEGLIVSAARRKRRPQLSKLPSWVPDWTVRPNGHWRYADHAYGD